MRSKTSTLFIIALLLAGIFALAFKVSPTIANTNSDNLDVKAQSNCEEKLKLANGDLEGPDYIQPPKSYKTLESMLAEVSLAEQENDSPSVPVAGTRELLVILVELSDVIPDEAHTIAYFDDRFFGTTPPSVHDFYLEVSYGTFTYVRGAVMGWYPSTYTQHYWEEIDSRDVVVEAIEDVDSFFDFSTYDTDASGTVTNEELTIFIIVSGSEGGAFHWWTGAPVATSDGVSVEGEFSATHENRHIGAYCHELGHDLGLPDLYDTTPSSPLSPDSEGIGNYGLMGGGSWTFSHLTAWSKIQLGWITPTVVTATGYYDVHDSETNPEAYVLVDPSHPNEYFLIENKHPTNSYYETIGSPIAPSGTYPDEGILIYHIDETKLLGWWEDGDNDVNGDEAHKGVDVECADSPTSHVINADDLDAKTNRGDAVDLWDIDEYDFTDTSTPCNANWYSGASSGIEVSEFPAASPTMRVYISVPPADWRDILIVNDDNGDASYDGTSLADFESALTDGDYDYMVWTASTMGNPPLHVLNMFKLVIWTCGDYYHWAVDPAPSDAAIIEAYVAQGGNLLLEGEDIGYDHDDQLDDDFMVNVAHAVFEVDTTNPNDGLTVTDSEHPVTQGLPASFDWSEDPDWPDGVTPTNEGVEVIRYAGTSWTAVTVFEGGSGGSVVYYAFPLHCLAETEGQSLVLNSVDWLLQARGASFDFGTDSSPVESGYTPVTESTVYSAASGYGWTSTSGLSSRDRGAPNHLNRDLVQSTTEHTFNVDLENGDYTVTIIMGDQSYMHDNIDVYAEGTLEINDLTAAAGSFMEMALGVNVADGQLNLRMQDDGGTDGNWVITALTVEPGLPPSPPTTGYFDFGTADSPVESGYVQVTEATLYSASTGYGWTSTSGLVSTNRGVAGDLITDFVHSATEHTFNVDLENGDYQISVTMSDRSYTAPIHDLIDVYAEDVQEINDLTVGHLQIQEVTFYTSVSDGQLNLRILDEGGADPSWLICALIVQPGTPPALPTDGYFDFGTALSPVEDGYVQVIETSFYSDSWGYGWTSTAGLSSRNRGAPDLLKEDLVQGTSEHTFNVDLANGDYNVTVIIGDQSYMHDQIDVYAEDVLEIDDFNPEVGAFPALTFYTSITDGQLNLRILDDGGTDTNWVINALAVEPGSPPTLPTERAFDFGPPRSPVELGYIRVSEVVVYSVPTGYGWSSTSGLVSRDRLEPDDLREDFIQSTTEHMFSVDLANGDYRVTVIIGDQSYMHDQIDVYAEDVLVIDDLTSTAGAFQELTFYLTLADEQLNLRISDDGGVDANWVINALNVQPGTPPTLPTEAAFDFGTEASPVETDYFQVTEATQYSSTLGYGWTSTSGLASRDRGSPDSLRCDLVQSTTEHTFNVDLANGDYTVIITIGDQSYAHDQIDVYAEGTLTIDDLDAAAGSFMEEVFGVTITDEQLNLIILDDGGTDANWVITALTVESGLPPAPPTQGYFDFGTSDSPVESTYTPVTETTLYSAASGYGWSSTSGLSSRDRGAPDDDLNRDLVQSTTEHTFNIDLADGTYAVTITIGDQDYAHDNIDVYAEEVLEADNVNSAAGSFQEVPFETTVSDGQLNLRIVDDGGTDANWVLNALAIVVVPP